MRLPLLFVLPLVPAHALVTRAANTSWHITDYLAVHYPSTSTLTFTFHDTSAANAASFACGSAPAFNSTWQVCGAERELLFKATESEVVLKRKMKADSVKYGIARQGTNWAAGDGGNMTELAGGVVYARMSAWEFPIQTMVGGGLVGGG